MAFPATLYPSHLAMKFWKLATRPTPGKRAVSSTVLGSRSRLLDQVGEPDVEVQESFSCQIRNLVRSFHAIGTCSDRTDTPRVQATIIRQVVLYGAGSRELGSAVRRQLPEAECHMQHNPAAASQSTAGAMVVAWK